MRALVARGFAGFGGDADEAPVDGSDRCCATTGPALSPEQADRGRRHRRAPPDRFAPFLLYGITGSGKTEVYLHAVEHALRRGRRALVLVPEIGLTPQLVERFRERFTVTVAVLHSGLTDTERLAAWRECVSGTARIVLGTRSAVFAPVADLGIVIVDEEHDASFKQHESGFRYSARDLAILRAQRAQVPIVLGSATPSLETLQNVDHRADSRACRCRAAPDRRCRRAPRSSTCASTRCAPVSRRRRSRPCSATSPMAARCWCTSTGAATRRRWPAPPAAGSRPAATATRASRCTWPRSGCAAITAAPTRRCPRSARNAATPCATWARAPSASRRRWPQLFPGVAIARLDRDVVRKRGDLESVVSRIASGEARILVGTQMVTKGHDFPSVTLVVVLNADQGLFSTDFRAPERVAQTIIQVAGRAGRGDKPGEVLIQTEYPDHPLLRSLLEGGLRRLRAHRTGRTRRRRLAAVRARRGAARFGVHAGDRQRFPARRRASWRARRAASSC